MKCGINKFLTGFLLCLIAFRYEAISGNDADSTVGSVKISLQYHYGFIISHRQNMSHLIKGHAQGWELNLSKPTDGKKIWEQYYNYPDIGLKFLRLNLGNDEQLGSGYACIPYIDFRLSGNAKVEFGISFGWGLGYIEKPFNQESNYKNVAIGSKLNGAISLGSDIKFQAFRKIFFNGGLGLTHFSNGGAITPNLGLNVITAKAGIIKYFGKGNAIKTNPAAEQEKKFRNSVYAAVGVKQIYPVLGSTYLVFALSAARLKRLSVKSAAGLGLDIHYDPSIIKRLQLTDEKSYNNLYGFRSGVNASYELILSDFSMLAQLGGYFYNRYISDGTFYQRMSFRYVVYKQLFICINLKTHWGKADFIEWGGGVKF